MIYDRLEQAARYASLLPGLAAGFEFLARPDLDQLAPGRYEVAGPVYALVNQETGRGQAGAKLEVHRRWLDIQVSLDGREQIGWRSLADCWQVAEPYDSDRDVAFFAERPECWLPLARGQFLIFFPADAHAPLGGEGPLHKVVVKVPV